MRTSPDLIHVGHGTQIGPLTLFPVWLEQPAPLPFDIAPTKQVVVSELPEATIGRLHVQATGNLPILLTEGTMLRGGFQTRVLARDMFIQPNRHSEVPTNCVEAGRWGGADRQHQTDGQVPARVRASLRGFNVPSTPDEQEREHQRQLRVWGSVRSYEQALGSSPHANLANILDGETHTDDDVQERNRAHARNLAVVLRRYCAAPITGQRGIIVAVNGQPLLMETIGSTRAFRKHLVALGRALASDAAVFQPVPTPSRRARRFAATYAQALLRPIEGDTTSVLLAGDTENISIRTLTTPTFQGAHLHTSTLNMQHELVLAA